MFSCSAVHTHDHPDERCDSVDVVPASSDSFLAEEEAVGLCSLYWRKGGDARRTIEWRTRYGELKGQRGSFARRPSLALPMKRLLMVYLIIEWLHSERQCLWLEEGPRALAL